MVLRFDPSPQLQQMFGGTNMGVQISRKFSGNMWTLDLLLQHFHDELKASESCLPVLKRVNENENIYAG